MKFRDFCFLTIFIILIGTGCSEDKSSPTGSNNTNVLLGLWNSPSLDWWWYFKDNGNLYVGDDLYDASQGGADIKGYQIPYTIQNNQLSFPADSGNFVYDFIVTEKVVSFTLKEPATMIGSDVFDWTGNDYTKMSTIPDTLLNLP